MDWVTVESFWSIEEAQLATLFLQAEEIPCRLESTAFAASFWHLANASDGVKLLVPRAAAEQAATLLLAVENRRGAEVPNVDDADEMMFDPESDPSEVEVDFDPDIVSAGDNLNEDDQEDRPRLLERLRRLKAISFLYILIGH